MKKLFCLSIFLLTLAIHAQDKPVQDAYIQPEDNSVYTTSSLEIIPDYPGGIQEFYTFFKKNFSKEAVKDAPKGKVKTYVSFVVEKDGSLTTIKVLRDPVAGMSVETIRVLKLSPKWKPGQLNGKTVRSSYNLPIAIEF